MTQPMTPSHIPVEMWQKSRRSNPSGNCVEVAVTPDWVGVRDSKDRGGPVLFFDRAAFADFVRAAAGGEFE